MPREGFCGYNVLQANKNITTQEKIIYDLWTEVAIGHRYVGHNWTTCTRSHFMDKATQVILGKAFMYVYNSYVCY